MPLAPPSPQPTVRLESSRCKIAAEGRTKKALGQVQTDKVLAPTGCPTQGHKLVAYHAGNGFLHGPGGQKSEHKTCVCRAGPVRGSRERPALSPPVPRFAAPHPSLCLRLHGASPGGSVSGPPLLGGPVTGLSTRPAPVLSVTSSGPAQSCKGLFPGAGLRTPRSPSGNVIQATPAANGGQESLRTRPPPSSQEDPCQSRETDRG